MTQQTGAAPEEAPVRTWAEVLLVAVLFAAATVVAAIAAAARHGKVAGMYVPDARVAEPWVARGMRFFETASEVDLIDSGARSLVTRFRELKK